MKKKLLNIVWLLVALFVSSTLTGNEVQAASKASKAKSAYKSFLADIYNEKDFRELVGKRIENKRNTKSIQRHLPWSRWSKVWATGCAKQVFTYWQVLY